LLTHTEVEQLANQIRAIGLHSSWNELLDFSQSVVGNLVEAYQALLKYSGTPDVGLSDPRWQVPVIVKKNLNKALTSLTSETQVLKWESEILGENNRRKRKNPEK
jgi:hypothetical protein